MPPPRVKPLVPRKLPALPQVAVPRVARPALPVAVAAEPIAREPIEPPAGLDSKALAAWHVAQIHAHDTLRAASFYDTGHHLAELLALRALYGAKDIKELCSKVGLGMSHMTANKYLQVARTFDRATAISAGIEKCYALTVYAKAIGRPRQAAAILAKDEPIRGVRGLRAKSASASKLYAAVRMLKAAAKAGREPSEIQAAQTRTAALAEKWVRKLGFRGAQTEVVRRGGEARVAIYISLEIADALETRVTGALAKLAPTLVQAHPTLVAPLRAALARAG
jgi:hypothetical protein